MTRNTRWLGLIKLGIICLLLGLTPAAAVAAQANAIKTNLVDRWITNVIEVRMPVNRFVNQFHTNWVDQFSTNRLEVFATNKLVKVLTNWVMISVVRTNFVEAFQTNFKTLNLTNWSTVLVFKTNWVTKPVTNLVEIDLPKSAAPTANVPPTQQSAAPQAARPTVKNFLALEAKRNGQLNRNNQVEVQLTVRWTNGTSALQVQQWRVEREDGTFLCFGQDQEFKRDLPIGKYKVEVRAQREKDGPELAALGTLAVSARDLVLRQTTPARN